ncbi:MAG: glutathione S-transferase family protein [Ottowia sp.]|uniref:glutathione S-transferase family protein n=1 Tax=Ottowia sp. TaxID=1898956 RepID=UPI0039E24554
MTDAAPALRLWGRITSLNVRKVVWALQELGLPFERIDAGLAFGVVQTPEYAARNPNRLVPLLQDGGYELWESNVIVRYLCARYGTDALYPQDLARRFDAERWMDWQQTTLNPAGSPAFLQFFRTPPAERRQEVIDASRAAMAPRLALLDAHLAQREWMAGARFSMADIPVACDIHRWWGLPQPRPDAPHVQRWLDAVLARPATRGVLDVPLG